MNNKELKITITANSKNAESNLKRIQNELQGTGQVVKRVANTFDTQGNVISTTINTIEKKGNQLYRTIQRLDKDGNVRSLSTSISDVKTQTDRATNSFSKLKNVLSLTGAIVAVKQMSKALLDVTSKAIDYSESLNLFNVVFKNIEKDGITTFSKVGKQATEFQEKLQNNFGANRTESMYYQALYQSMANSQGIADKYAQIMSENSTKLTYDLSSLFNSNQDDTAEALRAGIYAGQTKPLRSYGIDITETTLQATLDKMKETNSALKDLEVSTMSQGEKQILRYLSVLEQAGVAHGDFANTIESPANQLKIFTNQVGAMGVAIGNLFVGPLQRLLTFANTVVIVIKQVAESIAFLFNIKIKDYNTGIAKATDLSDSLDSVGNSADKAGKKMKELKRQTLAFDQINNINENNNSNKGSGSDAGGTGINQALLDALKGYDNGLDKVKLKAQQIADTIMKWLGFTYDAEEGVWKLGSAYDNLINSCKNLSKSLNVLGKYSFENLTNFYNNFLKPVAKWTLGTGLPRFVDITANGLMKTDWSNLNSKLNDFYKALTPFSINIGEGLLWFYEKVLVPLGSFTIGKVVPEFVQLLSSGIKILNNTIEVAKPVINFLWNNFLSPIASWTGGVAISVLKQINTVFDFISKSKVASTVTALGMAFMLIKTNGGLANTVLKLLPTPLKLLFANAEKTSQILGDKDPKGLSKIMLNLKSKVKSLISPLTDLKKSLDNVNFSGKSTFKAIKEGIDDWKKHLTTIDRFKLGIMGITGTVASLQGVSSAMKDVAENGLNMSNALQVGTSALGSIASGAMMGSAILPGWGTAIGGIVGGIGSLISGLTGYKKAQKEANTATEEAVNKSKEYVKTQEDEKQAIQEKMNSNLAEINYYERLSNELQNIVDSNGKVKKGYEDRASFIVSTLNNALGTEIKLNNGIVSNYKDMKKTIQEVIQQKKNEILLESYKEDWANAIKNQTEAYKNYKKALNDVETTKSKMNVVEKEYLELKKKIDSGNYTLNETTHLANLGKQLNDLGKTYKDQEKTMNNYKKTYKKYTDDIKSYEDLQIANMQGNQKEFNRILNEKAASELETNKKRADGWANALEKEQEIADEEISTHKNVTNEIKIQAYEQYEAVANSLTEQSKSVKEITPDIANGWIYLAKNSKDSFLKHFNQLPADIQQNVINKMQDQGYAIPKELQKGINKGGNPSIKFKTETKTVKDTLDKFVKNVEKTMSINMKVNFKGDATSATALASLFTKKADGGVLAGNQWKPITAYASGGLPSTGQMFIAREAGPELVGKIGSHTAVMNNGQIVDSVKAGVYEAVLTAMSQSQTTQSVSLDIHADEGIIVEKAVKGINGITDRTGECPIHI